MRFRAKRELYNISQREAGVLGGSYVNPRESAAFKEIWQAVGTFAIICGPKSLLWVGLGGLRSSFGTVGPVGGAEQDISYGP